MSVKWTIQEIGQNNQACIMRNSAPVTLGAVAELLNKYEEIIKKTIINDDGCPCTNDCCNHPQTEDKVTSEDDRYTVCHNCDAQCSCNN